MATEPDVIGPGQPIPPALSAAEWANGVPGVYGWDDGSVFVDWRHREPQRGANRSAIIAALNAQLSDADRRKITWAKLDALWDAIEVRRTESMADDPENTPAHVALVDLYDTLASYLPRRS